MASASDIATPSINMTVPSPKVSVVMSVYNGMPLLRDAVESILGQTLWDFEFIIVNDGSTDDSHKYLRTAAAADPRLLIIDQANTGLTRALITGVAQSRAPFIARMDADDVSAPDRLAVQLDLLERHPELSAASCGIEFVSGDLSRMSITEGRFNSAVWPLMLTFFNAIGGHGQMMFGRDAYDAVGGYDPNFRFAQDYDLWSRMLRQGQMCEASGLLYQMRLGSDRISTRHATQQRDLAVQIAAREYRLLTANDPDYEIVRDTLDFWHLSLDPLLPLPRLLAINRHLKRALASYLARFPDRRGAVCSARRQVAGTWLHILQFIPVRDSARWSLIIRIAASHDIAALPPALFRRASAPLRAFVG